MVFVKYALALAMVGSLTALGVAQDTQSAKDTQNVGHHTKNAAKPEVLR